MAARVENCQVGVFLGDATKKGRALIDRALDLPKERAEDADRRFEAGAPESVRFATKIVLARRMVERALDAGVPAAWVAGDAVYGSDHAFRKAIEDRGLGDVVGVRTDQPVCVGFRQVRVRALLVGATDDGDGRDRHHIRRLLTKYALEPTWNVSHLVVEDADNGDSCRHGRVRS